MERNGKAPLRTATELSLLLPIPILLIVAGYAQALFPLTNRSNPSTLVSIVQSRAKRTYPFVQGLPIFVDGEQWNNVVVPLLSSGDPRLTGWRGVSLDLGKIVTLLNNVVGPSGEIVFPLGEEIGLSTPTNVSLGKLFACDPFEFLRFGGKTGEYLHNAMGVIYVKAVEEGY